LQHKNLETLGLLRVLGKGLNEVIGNLSVRGSLFLTLPTQEPSDDSLKEGECVFYIDSSDLKIKYKDKSSIIHTFTISSD